MTQPTDDRNPETLDQYVNRRTKEILGMGGYDWTEFSSEEKMIAASQAEKEWANGERN